MTFSRSSLDDSLPKSSYSSPSMDSSEADRLWEAAAKHNREAARKLQKGLQEQARSRLRGGSTLSKGFRFYEITGGAIVSLGRLQSIFATPGGTTIEGQGYLWILTPEGAILGFKRIGKGNTYTDLKRKYGNDLFIRKNGSGGVVLYRKNGRLYAVYILKKQVHVPQKIEIESESDKAFNNTPLGE